MKKLGVMVVAALVAGAVNGWAQTNIFTITKFGGSLTIAGQQGVTRITGLDMTSNPVLLVVNETDNTVEFMEVAGGTTNSMFIPYAAAFTGNGKFAFDFYGCFSPANEGIPPFQGELVCIGKLSPAVGPKSVKVSLIGVWSDPTNLEDCDTGGVPAATFKGVASGKQSTE